MKVSEQLEQMQRDLRGLAIALVAADDGEAAIGVLEAADAVQKLRYAFDHNWIGEHETFPPARASSS
jgi:hypothetical protein